MKKLYLDSKVFKCEQTIFIDNDDVLFLEELKNNDKELLLIERALNKDNNPSSPLLVYYYGVVFYKLSLLRESLKNKTFQTQANKLFTMINSLKEEIVYDKNTIFEYELNILTNIDLTNLALLKQRCCLLMGFYIESSKLEKYREHNEESLAYNFYKNATKEEITNTIYVDAIYVLGQYFKTKARNCNIPPIIYDIVPKEKREELESLRKTYENYSKECFLKASELNHKPSIFYYTELTKLFDIFKERDKFIENIKRSLPCYQAVKNMIEIVKYNDDYEIIRYGGLIGKRFEYLQEYIDTCDDYSLLYSLYLLEDKSPYTDRLSKKVDEFIKNEVSLKPMIDLKYELYFNKDKYQNEYKKVLNYLVKNQNVDSIFEEILDKIDEGIEVEENIEKIKQVRCLNKLGEFLYKYKKNNDIEALREGVKYGYNPCKREYRKIKNK